MGISKRLMTAVAFTALMGCSVAVTAAPVSSLFAPGSNTFADSSGEFAFRMGANGPEAVTGALQEGDYLMSAVTYSGLWSPSNAAPSPGELTGVNLVQVATIAPTANSSCGLVVLPNGCGTFTFQAAGAALFNAMLSSFGVVINNPAALTIDNNTIGLAFEDTTANFNREGTIQQGIQTAADGVLRLVTGLISANGDQFITDGPLNIADFATIADGTKIGDLAFDGTITGQNFAGWTFDQQIVGDGTLRARGTSYQAGEFPIFDQTSVTVSMVPEPASLALMGLGLLGMGAASRRMRNKNKA